MSRTQTLVSVWVDPADEKAAAASFPRPGDIASFRPSLHIDNVVVNATGSPLPQSDTHAAGWWRSLAARCEEIASWYDARTPGGAR